LLEKAAFTEKKELLLEKPAFTEKKGIIAGKISIY
jgi:hypothetical protein